ncbi:MAG: hypothetical protein V4726_15580 [Verrucomicrobiota bacterium]
MSILLCLLCGTATAQDPRVRTSLPDQGELRVGQRVSFIVELLVPGYFSGSAAFDLPAPGGLLLIPPVGNPVVSSEEIGGVNYTVQRHELSVFSRRAGERTIPPFPVRFAFKRQPLDKISVPAKMSTEAITFTASLPPGAEHLGSLISARNLEAVESWKPEPGKAKAGDAFTRTITFTAPEVPAMAFPPFPAGKIDGLGIYPKAPEVLDHSERGELTGKRVDTVTYLCQRAGQFTIPATRLTWFDLDSKQLKTIDFPARTLDVAANPALASAAPAAAESTPSAPRSVMPFVRGGLVTAALLAAFTLKPVRIRILKAVRRIAAPFYPIHLQPLNPQTHPA